jgi:hypothetical protein
MTNDNEEPSAASAGPPCFAVWCCVRWARLTKERLEEDFNGELWIKMSMPAIFPVGSFIDLPTPRAWDSVSGALGGRIASWHLIGSEIVCEIDDNCHVGNDSVQELLAIGYSDHSGGYPDEVWQSGERLLR